MHPSETHAQVAGVAMSGRGPFHPADRVCNSESFQVLIYSGPATRLSGGLQHPPVASVSWERNDLSVQRGVETTARVCRTLHQRNDARDIREHRVGELALNRLATSCGNTLVRHRDPERSLTTANDNRVDLSKTMMEDATGFPLHLVGITRHRKDVGVELQEN